MAQVIKKGSDPSRIREVLNKLRKKEGKGFEAKKFCGVLMLDQDPMKIQKKLRDEW